MLSKGLRSASALTGCALMGGCSLINPYVKVDDVHVAGEPAQKAAQSGNGQEPHPEILPPSMLDQSPWLRSQNHLKAEHRSAQKQADAYRRAAIEHAKLKTGIAVTQVPLNGAIVAAAATNDRSDFPLIGGITSAATLGLGGLLSSPARQAIYLQAQTATLCAMAAYDVYFIPESDYKTYLADNSSLASDISATARARDRLRLALATYQAEAARRAEVADAAAAQAKKAKNAKAATPGDQIKARANIVDDAAQALLRDAETDLAAASTARASIDGVRGRVDEAGRGLGDRRMAIKAQVDQNVQTTELTLDRIKAAISASALASTQPSPAPPEGATGKAAGGAGAEDGDDPVTFRSEAATHAKDVKAAMDALSAALDNLRVDKSASDAWLRRELQKEQTATQVGACTVSAQVVLTATPDNPAEVSKDKSLKIQIHAPEVGGAPTYSKVGDGLTATMTTGGGYNYTLTIAEAGPVKPTLKDQTVVVSSGSQSVNVAFKVTDAVTPPKDSGGGTSGGDPTEPKPSTKPLPGQGAGQKPAS